MSRLQQWLEASAATLVENDRWRTECAEVIDRVFAEPDETPVSWLTAHYRGWSGRHHYGDGI